MGEKILVDQGGNERPPDDAASRHLVFTKNDEEPQCVGPVWTVLYGANTWPRLCYNGADHEWLRMGEAATPRNVGIVQWGAVLE